MPVVAPEPDEGHPARAEAVPEPLVVAAPGVVAARPVEQHRRVGERQGRRGRRQERAVRREEAHARGREPDRRGDVGVDRGEDLAVREAERERALAAHRVAREVDAVAVDAVAADRPLDRVENALLGGRRALEIARDVLLHGAAEAVRAAPPEVGVALLDAVHAVHAVGDEHVEVVRRGVGASLVVDGLDLRDDAAVGPAAAARVQRDEQSGALRVAADGLGDGQLRLEGRAAPGGVGVVLEPFDRAAADGLGPERGGDCCGLRAAHRISGVHE